MPLSLVLQLSTPEKIPEGNFGRQAQGWFLQQVDGYISAELAEKLHQNGDLRPYTVSNLFNRAYFQPSLGAQKPFSRCSIRFTILDDDLAESFLAMIKRRKPARMLNWWMEYNIEEYAILNSHHPWAGYESYEHLALLDPDQVLSRVKMEFSSPTTFNSDGVDKPIPLPGLVYRSAWRKWNQFNPLKITDEWLTVIDTSLHITHYNQLKTERWKFAQGGRGGATGFTGVVTYTLSEEVELKSGISKQDAKMVLNTLSKFAFYSGIGRHTGWGMGQVRPLGLSRDNTK